MAKLIKIKAKSVLSRSKVYTYTVNPYIGCSHGCHYCYARFIKRFIGISEKWGEFVCAKINAPSLLKEEVKKRKRGEVWISGLSDPYQPLERELKITRKCIEILFSEGWDVHIQTKSFVILDDIDLLKSYKNVDVHFTLTTADEEIRRIFEPKAPPVEERINALARLHKEGVRTHVMIAPLLCGADGLVEKIKDMVESVIVDRMNYHFADWVYKKYGIEWAKTDKFFREEGLKIKKLFENHGVKCRLLF